jgi:hypothetical protein
MHLRYLWFVVLIYLLTSCYYGEEQVLKINEQVVSKLEVLLAEKKFIEDPSSCTQVQPTKRQGKALK